MGELFVGGTELVEVPATPGYLIDQGEITLHLGGKRQ